MNRFAGRTALSVLGVAALFVALGAPARAQGLDPDQERARQLILRIKRSMREVDSLLLQGGSLEKAEKGVAETRKRIDELIDETESKSQSTVQNIDELIKLSKYQKSSSSSGGG